MSVIQLEIMKEIDFKNDLLPLKNQLYRVALRIVLDTAEAEDVVEDTLLKVWARRNELGEVKSVEALCTTICRNLSIDRKAKKDAQTLSIDEMELNTADNALLPDELMEQNELLERLKRNFNALPEKMKTLLQLRDIEGKSYSEIAAILEMTEDNVKVSIHRARALLKKIFLTNE